ELDEKLGGGIAHGGDTRDLQRAAARDALRERIAIAGQGEAVRQLARGRVEIEPVTNRHGVIAAIRLARRDEGVLLDARLENRLEAGGRLGGREIRKLLHVRELGREDIAHEPRVTGAEVDLPVDAPARLAVRVVA